MSAEAAEAVPQAEEERSAAETEATKKAQIERLLADAVQMLDEEESSAALYERAGAQ